LEEEEEEEEEEESFPHTRPVCSVFIETTNMGSASRCPCTLLRGWQKLEPAVGVMQLASWKKASSHRQLLRTSRGAAPCSPRAGRAHQVC